MNAGWPIIFGYYFWRFGSTRVLKAALRVMYVAALLRMGFGLVNYFAGIDYVIPGINYSIDPQDLRASGSIVFVLALIFIVMRGNVVIRFFTRSCFCSVSGRSCSGVLAPARPYSCLSRFSLWLCFAAGCFWSAGAACALLLVICGLMPTQK